MLLLGAILVASTSSRGMADDQVAQAEASGQYAIVVSQATSELPAWQEVIDALQARHPQAVTLHYASDVNETLPELKELFPRHVCFVCRHQEADEGMVREVHQLTRQFDDDPYTDCLWGILTGFDAANALAIAQTDAPLTVRRVASGTEIALEMCEEGIWYCELEQHRMVRREPGGEPIQQEGPADTTEALVNTLNDYQADLFVTSGHATSRGWQIGFRYQNGTFRSEAGQLYGLDTQGNRYDIDSSNPKVYLPIGNCLMGNIDGEDAMALAWMNSAGVHQMIGYVVPTWYGYSGWGCLDYFVEQPGRYTFAEAFFANQHALIHRLEEVEISGADRRGLEFDRDVVAFYGDPAWVAKMAPAESAWEQTLTEENGVYTLEILPRRGEATFQPINTNGSQRGGRPIVAFLPNRVQSVELIEGADLNPLVTDNFILVPNPGVCDPERPYRVVFRAE